MKRRNLLLLTTAAAVLLFSSFMVLYPGGAPAAYTGSPGDGKNCSQCHGAAATTATGWITSNIPAGGYIPGQTYQITATNSISGSGKYGFEISPQNASGALKGTLTAGSNSQLVGSGKYVTHTSASSSLKVWTFSWTAPAAGTGNVTFYGAFARNYSGPTTLSTLPVQEQMNTGIADIYTEKSLLAPNPNNGHFTVFLPENHLNTENTLLVSDQTGKTVYQNKLAPGSDISHELSLKNLPKGVYFFVLRNEKDSRTEKFIIQ